VDAHHGGNGFEHRGVAGSGQSEDTSCTRAMTLGEIVTASAIAAEDQQHRRTRNVLLAPETLQAPIPARV
jgi:hypothetical protein